jgi:hypothetical protein
MKRYGSRPGFLAIGLPEVGSVLLRADTKTMEEADGFLSGLVPLGSQEPDAQKEPDPR